VRSGDSLGLIASKFYVKTYDLVRWNNLNGQKYIQPGQKLKVYVDVRNTST
jgi:membrane-bound lytic murein transglycosylase D